MASPGPMQPANASERAQPPYRCYVLVAEGAVRTMGVGPGDARFWIWTSEKIYSTYFGE
jgi:hypothetical protein